MLGGYEQVHAGLAERIVAMAEKEQNHRHALESTDLRQSYRLAHSGQFAGVFALLVMAALAAYLGFLGEAGWATVVATLDIAAVVGVFVTGQLSSRSESSKDSESSNSDRGELPSGSEPDTNQGEPDTLD
ncbi:DUF2335 domain-containing protein [Kitasatospora griseola]|uniref:DUF2335 domain-containing protein n=1 Tax=Kitasatospora griseola TaxID=2064 RepID=UPI00381914DE